MKSEPGTRQIASAVDYDLLLPVTCRPRVNWLIKTRTSFIFLSLDCNTAEVTARRRRFGATPNTGLD
jgi:hypothetical protein